MNIVIFRLDKVFIKRIVFTFALLYYYATALCQTKGLDATKITTNKQHKTFALIIGISNYTYLDTLSFCGKDAEAFRNFLVSQYGMGLDEEYVSLLIDAEATSSRISEELLKITENTSPGDKVYFFFSGHADTEIKDDSLLRTFLLLKSCPRQNYLEKYYDLPYLESNDLVSKFIKPLVLKNVQVNLVMDACHSSGVQNQLSGGELGKKTTLEALRLIDNVNCFYSCRSNQVSYETQEIGGGRGVFSYLFMEGLYGKADQNGDSLISIRDIERYLEDKMPELNKMLSSKTGIIFNQSPVIKSENKLEVIVKTNSELVAEFKRGRKTDEIVKIIENDVLKVFSNNISEQKVSLSSSAIRNLNDRNISRLIMDLEQYQSKFGIDEIFIKAREEIKTKLMSSSNAILEPMMKDVANYKGNKEEIEFAMRDLNSLMSLLDSNDILYNKIVSRNLYLKILYGKYNDNKEYGRLGSDTRIEALYKCINLEPSAPYHYYDLANDCLEAGDFIGSLVSIMKYMNLVPYSADGHLLYAIIRQNFGDDPIVESEFRKALELAPNSWYIRNLFAIWLAKMNRDAEAEKEYLKTINIDYKAADVHYNYGNLLLKLGRIRDAKIQYLIALQFDVNDAEAHHNLAVTLEYQKDYKEAERHYLKAIEIIPNYTDAIKNYSKLLVFLNRQKEADILIDRLEKLKSTKE